VKEEKMSERYLLKEAVQAYLASLQESSSSATTQKTYARCLDLALAHFGEDRDLKKLLAAHVARFFASDAVNKKPDGSPRAKLSVDQVRRVFRQMLTHCHEKGLIDAVPLPRAEQDR
jgi:hypothetical protein